MSDKPSPPPKSPPLTIIKETGKAAVGGAIAGGVTGALIGGPVGAIAGKLIGAKVGAAAGAITGIKAGSAVGAAKGATERAGTTVSNHGYDNVGKVITQATLPAAGAAYVAVSKKGKTTTTKTTQKS